GFIPADARLCRRKERPRSQLRRLRLHGREHGARRPRRPVEPVMPRPLPVRAYLLHLSHYDPEWWKRKAREKRFSLSLALEAVDAMAAAGYNTLVVDCEDAVRYRSHPELARPYTAPMRDLATLARRARKRGLDVVPKINFSQSHFHF